jgi:predicted nucleic acid-binding protein
VIKYEFNGSNGYHEAAKNLQDSTIEKFFEILIYTVVKEELIKSAP